MLVKAIMNRTSLKFYDNDLIEDVCDFFLDNEEGGGAVYNLYNEFIGMFTSIDAFKGYRQKKQYINEVIITDYRTLKEADEIISLKFGSASINPVCNVDGEITGYITENQYLKALSKEAQVKTKHYNAVFDSAHNGILSIDAEGIITSINPAALRMARASRDKSVGRFLSEVVSPTGLLDVVRTGKSHTEKYKVRKRVYITNRSPIKENDKVIGAVGVFQDISEIEFISNELETFKRIVNELDTVVESSSDGICIVEKNGNVQRVNKRFQKMLNIDEEVQGVDAQLPEYVNRLITNIFKDKKRKSLMQSELETENSLIISGRPILNDSVEVERVVISIKDMTEMERMRDELAEAKRKLNELNIEESTEFVYKSQPMKRLISTVEQVAGVDVTVLLTGESGVGKGEIANLITKMSDRSKKRFVKVNCGAIPDTLIESELFGYEPGAFTGASEKGKKGYFELAEGGTILLDEISEIPQGLQVKLLSVLQDREIMRVGSEKTKKIDIRVIAATNQNLEEMVMDGSFREDLFYRLNVVPLLVPPLRERIDDIPSLVKFYSDYFKEKYKKELIFTEGAVKALLEYHWPGNVRELVNVLERAFIISPKKEVEYLEVMNLLHLNTNIGTSCLNVLKINEIIPMKQAVEKLEIQLIQKALREVKSYRKVAELLEVNVSTISRKMQKFNNEKGLDIDG